jgi:hypothetical protein
MAWMIWGRFHSRVDFTLHILLTGSYVGWIVIAGRWDWASVYLRWVTLIIMHIAFIVAFKQRKKNTQEQKKPVSATSLWAGRIVMIGMSVWFGILAISALFGNAETDRAVSLDFPLKGGTFYIGQGGATDAINQHNGVPAQNFALDINRLSALGNRATTLFPSAPEDYAIYGTSVISPCDAQVLSVVDGLPDQKLGERDTKNLAGNHVWLRCKWVDILLAHLQPNSISVSAGQMLTSGAMIGRAGNSGNTTAPHLHVHAQKQSEEPDFIRGEGVPIRFNGSVPVRGDIIKVVEK